MTRTKPTEKYQEYERKLRQRDAFIAAQLNGTVEWLTPTVHKDRLSNGQEVKVTIGVIMADWIEEVQVFLLSEREVAAFRGFPAKRLYCNGELREAIKTWVAGLQYMNRSDGQYQSQMTWIAQLDAIRTERFDENGTD